MVKWTYLVSSTTLAKQPHLTLLVMLAYLMMKLEKSHKDAYIYAHTLTQIFGHVAINYFLMTILVSNTIDIHLKEQMWLPNVKCV